MPAPTPTRPSAPAPRGLDPRFARLSGFAGAAAARPAPAARVRARGWQVPWRRLAPLGVVLFLYGSSRACIRHNASEAAWTFGMERLGRMMESHQAYAFLVEYHDGCFWRNYSTGWAGPSASTFDQGAYAECVLERVRAAVGTQSVGTPPRPRPVVTVPATASPVPPGYGTPEPVERGAPLATSTRGPEATEAAIATATATAAPTEPRGQLLVGDVKVSGFRREPQLTARVTFMAIGSSGDLQGNLLCSYVVRCGEGLELGAGTAPCLAPGNMRLNGTLDITLSGAAPAGTSCTVGVSLIEGESSRSNTATVPLS